MLSALLALAFVSPSFAASKDADLYAKMQALEMRVEYSVYGSTLRRLTFEKAQAGRICRRESSAAPWIHFEYRCFSLSTSAAEAEARFEESTETEFSVFFRSDEGRAYPDGVRVFHKFEGEGFCRKIETSAPSLPEYGCYEPIN